MRAIRITVISTLTIGLLAGSAASVAAQNAIVSGAFGESETGATFDDPRPSGEWEDVALTEVVGEVEGFSEGGITIEEFRITIEEGSWSGVYAYGFFLPDEDWDPEGYFASSLPAAYRPVDSGNHWFLIGEGGYEGLTAARPSTAVSTGVACPGAAASLDSHRVEARVRPG